MSAPRDFRFGRTLGSMLRVWSGRGAYGTWCIKIDGVLVNRKNSQRSYPEEVSTVRCKFRYRCWMLLLDEAVGDGRITEGVLL
jgi:hypothetical protein